MKKTLYLLVGFAVSLFFSMTAFSASESKPLIAEPKARFAIRLAAELATTVHQDPHHVASNLFLQSLEKKQWRFITRDSKGLMFSRSSLNICSDNLLKKQDVLFIYGKGEVELQGEPYTVNVLSFRGSQTTNNWLFSDFQLQRTSLYQPQINDSENLTDYKVQCGFNQYVREAGVDSSNLLSRFFHDARANRNDSHQLFIITGHSLGGAAALIFASTVLGDSQSMTGDPNLYLVTFGQPAVGTMTFKKHFSPSFAHYFRLINEGDIVPNSTKLFGYQHMGKTFSCKSRDFCAKRLWDVRKNKPLCRSAIAAHSPYEYRSIAYGLVTKSKGYEQIHHCKVSAG